MLKKIVLTLCIVALCSGVSAQLVGGKLSLEQAIALAHSNSPSAQMAQLSFMSKYWSFRSYKAQLLPSINLNGNIGNYNRSTVEVRDPQTGEISYVANNTLNNSLSLSVDQQIALTGGTISVNTSLARLDQFTYENELYNSTPISISYNQPIRSFNSLKWQKKSAPLEYERAKRVFLETMEGITITTTQYFFAVLSAQTNLRNNLNNYEDTKRMYEIAQKRFEISTITKSELLQLELAMLNSNLAINESSIAMEQAIFNLKLYLGIGNSSIVELIAPSSIPDILLDYDFVLNRALVNSSHQRDMDLQKIYADQSVAQAKGDRGVQLQLSANLGLSQTAYSLSGAYNNPLDREVVGLSVSMPIFDWGMSRGKIKMAEAERDVIATEIEQEQIKFRQNLAIKVMEFNSQTQQCEVSQKAMQIAAERYEIMVNRFENGGVNVIDMNTAQEELEAANNEYVAQLSTFWSIYYDLQKTSLYDYIKQRDISTEFDNIIDSQL